MNCEEFRDRALDYPDGTAPPSIAAATGCPFVGSCDPRLRCRAPPFRCFGVRERCGESGMLPSRPVRISGLGRLPDQPPPLSSSSWCLQGSAPAHSQSVPFRNGVTLSGPAHALVRQRRLQIPERSALTVSSVKDSKLLARPTRVGTASDSTAARCKAAIIVTNASEHRKKSKCRSGSSLPGRVARKRLFCAARAIQSHTSNGYAATSRQSHRCS
jgi:hypothetical protein